MLVMINNNSKAQVVREHGFHNITGLRFFKEKLSGFMRSECCLQVPPFQFVNQPHEILCGHLAIGAQNSVILFYQL
jgi:hypothetical protein